MHICLTHLARLSQARCVSSSVTQTSLMREKCGLPALRILYPPRLEVGAIVGLAWGYGAFCDALFYCWGDVVCACCGECILEAFVVFDIFFDCVGVGCTDGYSVTPLPLAVSGVFVVGER